MDSNLAKEIAQEVQKLNDIKEKERKEELIRMAVSAAAALALAAYFRTQPRSKSKSNISRKNYVATFRSAVSY